jgi:hypothetical protein
MGRYSICANAILSSEAQWTEAHGMTMNALIPNLTAISITTIRSTYLFPRIYVFLHAAAHGLSS